MFEEDLIRYCSPTLAGLKTGCMFVFRWNGTEHLVSLLRDYNNRLSERGVRITLLRKKAFSALVYVYRPEQLRQDLKKRTAAELLEKSGYQFQEPSHCLAELRKRLTEKNVFPHEIGLFLGYPPEDVRGFIQYKGACYKYCGCWKVYGDVEESQKCFERLRKCRQIFYQQWLTGKSLEYLTVSA